MKKALTIVVRYSCARRQFGESKDKEDQIWEYSMQRYRILPFLASSFAYHFLCKWQYQIYQEVYQRSLKGDVSDEYLQMNAEIHAISSGAKPICTWTAKDLIQEARQCCGGEASKKNSNKFFTFIN